MKTRAGLLFLVACGLLPTWSSAAALVASGELLSPENQVFQFVQRGTYTYESDDVVSAAAYLWIPEKCQRLRGLLILGENMPEHRLVGHPAIRAVCAEHDLGIVWCSPRFISVKMKDEAPKTVAFLQQLLDGLAKTSGYDEVATVPWLPMGESFHLRMVYQLLNHSPERCLAGICIKNSMSLTLCKNRETPVLIAVGTAQEWFQDKADIRTKWQDLSFYDALLKERKAHPGWPVSILVEGGSGHFDCTEPMTAHFAAYISAVAKARLPAVPGEPLRPVALSGGFVAGLPLPGRDTFEPTAVASATPVRQAMAWYFDAAMARDAFQTAAINWKAASQFLAYLDPQGQPAPMLYQGITSPIPIETGADGITFELKGCAVPAIPAGFVGAGEPLAVAPGTPTAEWVRGSVAPLGQGRFRFCLDRTWRSFPDGKPSIACVVLRHKGTAEIRDAVQPGYVWVEPNKAGASQTITFAPIPDQTAGTKTLPLAATASSGMPVRFFLVAGPAVVEGNALRLTPIPPRTRFPIEVTVTAWQWGRAVEPKVQTAEHVTRTFFITNGKAAEAMRNL